MRILFLLARQFNLLLQVKELLAEHCDQATIAKRTGLQSFVVRNYIPMSRQYAAEELKAAVNDCVQMEEDVKTGKSAERGAADYEIQQGGVRAEFSIARPENNAKKAVLQSANCKEQI